MFTLARHRLAARWVAAGAVAALTLTAAACSSTGTGAAPSTTGSATTGSANAGSSAAAPSSGSDGSAAAGASSGPAASSGAIASTGPAAGSSDGGAGSTAAITIYSGQHESLVKDLIAKFTADTGIKVTLRSGDDAELANQIVEEGAASPADVFLSEEPSPLGLLDSKGLLAPVDKSTLAEVDANLVPSTGNWMPYAARTRVLYYNPSLISEADLPNSIMDLTAPQWKGKFGYAPSGAFAATVSYLIATIGSDKTLEWLKGIKANGVNEQSNGKVRDAVEAGQIAIGLSNHYYWWILANSKGGPANLKSKIYYFDHPDAGSLLLASGAGVVKASKHQAEAQKFLAWLGSADGGQQVIASDPAAQYPVAPGVQSKVGLQPLADLKYPKVDQNVYANTSAAKDLIIQAGIA